MAEIESRGAMLDVVVDLSHREGEVDLILASEDGIVGVIHKATQGTTLMDPAYHGNRAKAFAPDLLWGAYHFALPGRGASQARHFLETVEPGPKTLLALDLEGTQTGMGMTLAEAQAFVSTVFEKVGRWPGIRCGRYVRELLGSTRDPVLGNCWLWLSQYDGELVVPETWRTWTLWRYTDGTRGFGPRPIKGIGRCGRNRFNGDPVSLRRLWGASPADPTIGPAQSDAPRVRFGDAS